MKVETFWTMTAGDPNFDNDVNEFIKDKKVIRITTGDSITGDSISRPQLVHTLTVLYTEVDE